LAWSSRRNGRVDRAAPFRSTVANKVADVENPHRNNVGEIHRPSRRARSGQCRAGSGQRSMIREGEEIIGAIIGGSKCGKTTLAVALVLLMWRRHRLRSLVYTPFPKKNNWGPTAWVTDNLDAFKRVVFGVKGCAVFWDESSDSLDRYSSDDRKFFTRIRHEHKAFFLIAHDLKVMTPLMRGNLSDLYIFAQGPKRAAVYAEEFNDGDLMQLTQLQKREFVHKRPFEKIRRMLPTLAELNSARILP
jgi:hypothetical protein